MGHDPRGVQPTGSRGAYGRSPLDSADVRPAQQGAGGRVLGRRLKAFAGVGGVGLVFATVASLSLGAPGGNERAVGTVSPALPGVERGSCESLSSRVIEGIPDAPTRIYTGQPEPGGEVTITDRAASGAVAWDRAGKTGELPAHCLVRGYIGPQISFEVRLPDPSAWNGNYQQVACGGFCGSVRSDSCFPGLERGYAVATHDGGHDTEQAGFDGVWGWNNRPGEVDFGYRANHVVALATKAIIAAYYGEAAEYSYIVGCSKGGTSAVKEALRYPDDFDGAIAAAPVLDYQGRVATSFSWLMQALLDNRGRPLLSAEDFRMVHEAVLDECDGLDGLEDRVLNDPARCEFRPGVLRCGRLDGSAWCLSQRQVSALRKVYAAPRNSEGEVVYPAGQTLGSELGWEGWLTQNPAEPRPTPFALEGANQYLAYMAFENDPGPSFTYEDFSFDRHVEDLEALSPVYDAIDTDLSEFRDRGGKLILLHGTADPAISSEATIDYYEHLIDDMGGRRATQAFARLFLTPGASHCTSQGPGVARVDPLTALEKWVEHDEAPETLSATHEGGEGLERTMPLFPYPRVPVYSGEGDPTDPASYEPAVSAAWSP